MEQIAVAKEVSPLPESVIRVSGRHPEDNQVNGSAIIPAERGKILYAIFNVK